MKQCNICAGWNIQTQDTFLLVALWTLLVHTNVQSLPTTSNHITLNVSTPLIHDQTMTLTASANFAWCEVIAWIIMEFGTDVHVKKIK